MLTLLIKMKVMWNNRILKRGLMFLDFKNQEKL